MWKPVSPVHRREHPVYGRHSELSYNVEATRQLISH
jgi:hypothetical protein